MKLIKNVAIVLLLSILFVSLVACRNNALNDAVDELNNDQSLHAQLDGLYTVRAEARGSSTIVIIFLAQQEELADIEISQAVSESAAPEFEYTLGEMKNANIRNPKIVLEFLDTGGGLIYRHEFS